MLIVAAILAIFVYGMIAAMLGTILPDFSQRFNLSPKQNGNIALAQAVGLIAASIFAGPLIDSQGTKAGLMLGLGLAALALLLLPRATGYGSIMGYLLLLGLGGGCIVTGAFALAGSMGGNTARTFNLVNLFFGLGGMATPFIACAFTKYGYRRRCHSSCSSSTAIRTERRRFGVSRKYRLPLMHRYFALLMVTGRITTRIRID